MRDLAIYNLLMAIYFELKAARPELGAAERLEQYMRTECFLELADLAIRTSGPKPSRPQKIEKGMK